MSHVTIVCDLLSTFLRFRRFIAMELVRSGHKVTLIVSDNDEPYSTFFREQQIELRVVPMDRTSINPLKDWKYGQELKRHLLEIQPDRILSYQAKAAVWSAIAAKSLPKCRIAVLFPGLGYLFSPPETLKQNMVQWAGRCLYRYAFSEIDTAFFQNPDDIKTIEQRRILPKTTHKLLVNGSGVCLQQFSHSSPCVKPIRFVMATRLLADKGVREFATAAGELKQRYGDAVDFQIAGGFDSNPTAIQKAEVEDWERNGWLTYRGHVQNMTQFLADCSVFVLPSYYMEGTPRSILEAMATGRPIITTDNRGCRETVNVGENGTLIPVRDAARLQDAMEHYIKFPENLEKHGQASRRIAETKYDVNRVVSRMIEALQLEANK